MKSREGNSFNSFADVIVSNFSEQVRLGPRYLTYWSLPEQALFLVYEKYVVKMMQTHNEVIAKCSSYDEACVELYYIIHQDIQLEIDKIIEGGIE